MLDVFVLALIAITFFVPHYVGAVCVGFIVAAVTPRGSLHPRWSPRHPPPPPPPPAPPPPPPPPPPVGPPRRGALGMPSLSLSFLFFFALFAPERACMTRSLGEQRTGPHEPAHNANTASAGTAPSTPARRAPRPPSTAAASSRAARAPSRGESGAAEPAKKKKKRKTSRCRCWSLQPRKAGANLGALGGGVHAPVPLVQWYGTVPSVPLVPSVRYRRYHWYRPTRAINLGQ